MPSTAVENYLENLRLRNCTDRTLTTYRKVLDQAERGVGKALSDATREDIEAYFAAAGRRGLKPKTVSKAQTILRSFYKWAMKMELVTADPTVRLEAPKAEKRLPIYLSKPGLDTLFAALRSESRADKREAAIVKTFYYTGCRSIELGRLTYNDLLLDEDQPAIRVFGKGNKERIIPLSDDLMPTLWAWLAVHPTGHGHVFTDLLAGHPLGYDSLYKIVKAVVARAGLPSNISPHKLRSTFATHLVQGDVPINEVSEMLGHASVATTQIYAHTKVKRSALNALRRPSA